MKNTIFILLFFLSAFNKSVFSQEKEFHSLQEVLDHHIAGLQKNISNYSHIFITTNLAEGLKVPDKVFQVENSLNAKFLDKKDQNYLVRISIYANSVPVKIDISNFKVVKVTNKKLTLLNLGSGNTYTIH
ncbi:hypothetical protein ACS5PU_02265 [Pedobacter sp. GSP4]|uniref:hypothetical protein n=1 Tax=Pedobacter sp. GSP4 TaxID=3453716 RepID=UPI003EEF7DEE